MRTAFKGLLPQSVRKRPKFGFMAPSNWLWEEKHSWIEDLLSESAVRRTGIFDYRQVESLRHAVANHNGNGLQLTAAGLLTGILSTQILAR